MNLVKTKMLTKNMSTSQRTTLQEITGIEIEKKIRYLGIIFSNKTSSLFQDNFEKIMKTIVMDLRKWGEKELSLLGKIASVKMNVLPRLLFLFQTILITIDKKYFRELN